jgi:hypothetical protein
MSAGTLVHATNEDEIDAVFTTFVREQIGAVILSPDALFASRREQLVRLHAPRAVR